jgi:prokaryotic YEATS domain
LEGRVIESLIPLVQTLIWLEFAVVILFMSRLNGENLFRVLFDRVKSGAAVSLAGVSIGSPPAEIRKGEHVGVTAEGIKGAETAPPIEEALQRNDFPPNVVESPYLVHEAQVIRLRTDRTTGLYRVRVSLESDPIDDLKNVKRVTNRLHPTFPNRVIATEAREKNFELWVNVYGEFTIVAVVEHDGYPALWLTQYLDLPGRPPE